MSKTVLFQTIQFGISTQFFIFFLLFFTQLDIETVLFQAIHFSIDAQFSSFWPIDRILSSASTRGQNEPCNNGNKGVLYIPQSYNITGATPSDCLVSYPGYSLREPYPSAEILSVYSTASVDWDKKYSCI